MSMKSTKSSFIMANALTIAFVLFMAAGMAWLMYSDISRMQAATTNCEYYKNFIYLIDNIARTYFFCIIMGLFYLTYVHKQYTKWCMWLFYLLGISVFVYYVIASNFSDYVFRIMEPQYMDQLPSMFRSLYTGPLYWMFLAYFFIPKILKDAKNLKDEQDLIV